MIIRKATPEDSDAIAIYLLLAMEEIVYTFIGERNPEKASAFMRHFTAKANNQYSYQNCWVAEEEGKVVGAANVYDGGRLHELRQPVLEYIRNHYHEDFEPEDETGSGEYYLDTIGVNPGHHGRGIGSQLLQFVVEEYVTRQSRTLGLLVDEDNPKAKRLYTRLGFNPVGKKVLLGKLMEHLQIQGRTSRNRV